jgi:uncharacterized membrane protein YgdD (TMEM256/DUF423 family)
MKLFKIKYLIIAGASLLMIGVIAGAFGAHGLQGKISDYYLKVYEKAVLYQLIHGLAIISLANLAIATNGYCRLFLISGWLMFLGVVIFSGTLYLLVLTKISWLGAITPIGGTLFIIAWGLVVYSGLCFSKD